MALSHGADFVVLAPIFEKANAYAKPLGLETLRNAANIEAPDHRVEAGDNRAEMPVLALGGINLTNARFCIAAGAAGVAGIRLFQKGNLRETVRLLRRS